MTTAAVSAGALALFGGTPMTGRMFTEQEAPTDAKLAVLSHGVWQRRFGGTRASSACTVLIDREPFEVIGIMPAGFVPGYVARSYGRRCVTEASFNISHRHPDLCPRPPRRLARSSCEPNWNRPCNG